MVATAIGVGGLLLIDLVFGAREDSLRVKGQLSGYMGVAGLISTVLSIWAVFKMSEKKIIPITCIVIGLLVMYYSLYIYGLSIY